MIKDFIVFLFQGAGVMIGMLCFGFLLFSPFTILLLTSDVFNALESINIVIAYISSGLIVIAYFFILFLLLGRGKV